MRLSIYIHLFLLEELALYHIKEQKQTETFWNEKLEN